MFHDGNYSYFELVDTCPICGASIAPKFLSGKKFCVDDSDELDIKYSGVFQCMKCRNTFMVQYGKPEPKDRHSNKFNQIEYMGPIKPKNRDFEDVITDISPDFSNIYNQANAAEVYGLDQIAGCGYRRAFEFLIKDYLCHCTPELTDAIKKEFLGTSIKTRIDHPKLKEIAERTAWLGNDLTHYEQRYEDKDIKDLKLLIDLTVHWIVCNLLSDQAIEEIQPISNK